MQLMSEYFSDDQTKSAKIYLDNIGPVVQFCQSDDVVETRTFYDHTLQYAEDAAENYIMGVLKITTAA